MSEPTVPLWDRADLMQRILHNEQLLGKLLQQFLLMMPTYLTELKHQVSVSDLSGIRATAHTVKGVAANMSFLALKAIAYDLEQAAKQSDLSKVPQLLNSLESVFEQTALLLQQEHIAQ